MKTDYLHIMVYILRSDGISYKHQDEKSSPRYKVIIVDEGIYGTDKS